MADGKGTSTGGKGLVFRPSMKLVADIVNMRYTDEQNLADKINRMAKVELCDRLLEPLANGYQKYKQEAEDLKQKYDELERKYNELMKKVGEKDDKLDTIVSKIGELTERLSTNNVQSTPSYATVASQPATTSQRIKKLNNYYVMATDDSTKIENIEKAINKGLRGKRVRINDIRRIRSEKGVRITSPDTGVIELLAESMEEGMKIEKEKPFLPEIFVHDVGKDFEDLIDDLKEKNGLEDDKHLKIVRVMEQRRKEKGRPIFNAIIRLTGKSLNKLNMMNRIYVENSALRYKENFYIKRCTNCYSYGHTSKNCHHEEETCTDCGLSKEENHPCVNGRGDHCPYCYKQNIVNKRRTNYVHNHEDLRECHTYQQALERLKNRIDYNYD